MVLSKQRIKLIWDASVPTVQISEGQEHYACAAFHCGRDLSVCFLACSYILDIGGNNGLLLRSRHTGVTALICFVYWLVHLLGGRMLHVWRCVDINKNKHVLTCIQVLSAWGINLRAWHLLSKKVWYFPKHSLCTVMDFSEEGVRCMFTFVGGIRGQGENSFIFPVLWHWITKFFVSNILK